MGIADELMLKQLSFVFWEPNILISKLTKNVLNAFSIIFTIFLITKLLILKHFNPFSILWL